jgi:predicted acylesterase/phospholipase RssA
MRSSTVFAPLFLLATLMLAACASLPRIEYTESDQALAKVAGMPKDIRLWADAPQRAFRPAVNQIRERARRTGRAPTLLALSGGADDGAYGSGFLNGWSETGTRPEFEIVSGISTGALIAPYAFLGEAYDDELRGIFTEVDSSDIFVFRGLRGLLGAGIADNTPLREMVARQVTPELLEAIAVEHAKGRRLLVATTNLDAQRTVVWNMGRIAEVGTPRALEVFRVRHLNYD